MGACANTGGINPRARLLDSSGMELGAAVTALESDAGWPSSDWWRHWDDPQLDALIQQALVGQPDLRVARARLDLAQAQTRIAGAAFLPQLDAASDLGRRRYPRYDTPSPPGGYTVWSNDVGFTLSYELDLWGRNRAILEGSLSAARATAAEMHAVQLALETAVTRAYIQLSLQYQLHDASQAILTQAENTRDIVARRVAAGLASRLELSQAEAQLAITAGELEQTNEQIALARHQIAALIGQAPGAGDGFKRPELKLDFPVSLPATLPAELVRHRPDMVAQRWLVQSAAKGIAVARADFYPRIDLQATAGLASATTFGNFFTFVSNDAEGHSLGAAIYLPIFEGGKLQGRYGAAVANYDAAVETYNRSVLTAMQQVADQVVSLQSLATQQDDAEKSVAEARSAFGLADRGYRSGITEFLNVLVTQATLLRQRQQLALIQARRLDAWTLLMQSLGGGLESSAPLRADAPADDSDGRHAP